MFDFCDLPNRQKCMVASFNISATFTAKFELVFVLTQENAFYYKANRKKMALWLIKIAFHLRGLLFI